MRRRLSTDEQTIFGMLLAGFGRPAIADQLDVSTAELESRLRRMLTIFDATPSPDATAAPYSRDRATWTPIQHDKHARRRTP
jgi:hypothetical protein